MFRSYTIRGAEARGHAVSSQVRPPRSAPPTSQDQLNQEGPARACPGYPGELIHGSLMSRYSGGPTASDSISSNAAFASGGKSWLSPLRASTSLMKYKTDVNLPSSCPTETLPRMSGRAD